MYNVNDVVVYGNEGICTITDIKLKKFAGETDEYFILTPLGKECNTVYVPKGNLKILTRMRKILTHSEADELIHSLPENKLEWIPNERERQSEYKDIILHGKPEDLFMMIRSLYDRQDEQTLKGKKLHASDERFLREAERMLFDEIAYALDIEPVDVLPMIVKICHRKKTSFP